MEKRDKIKRFFKREDAERTLISDLLIRYIISSIFELKNQNISFYFNEYGKPFLKGSNGFHFNISHSGKWVVCAIDKYPLGIDIEKILPMDFNIAKRFFSKNEYEELMEKKDGERLAFFYDLWTLKESYIKATDRGLATSLDCFSIAIDRKGISISSTEVDTAFYFKQYRIDKNYKLAVCSRNNFFPNKIILITLAQLINWFFT